MQNIMECCLCLEISGNGRNSIPVNSTEWQELNMQYIVEKHLWKMENLYDHSHVCAACWQELSNFHSFYSKIEQVHTKLSSLTKTEVVPRDVINEKGELTSKNSIGNKENYQLESETLFIQEESPLKMFKENAEETGSLKKTTKRKSSLKKDRNYTKRNVARSKSQKVDSSTKIKKLEASSSRDKIDINLIELANDYKETKKENPQLDSEILFIKEESSLKHFENVDEVSCLIKCTKHKSSLKKDKKRKRKNVARGNSEKSPQNVNISTEIKNQEAEKNLSKIGSNLAEVADDPETKIGESFSFQKSETDKNLDGAGITLKEPKNISEKSKLNESFNDESNCFESDNDTSLNAVDSPKLDQLPQEEDEFIAEHFQIKCYVCQISLATFSIMIKHYKEEHNQRGYVLCCNNKFCARIELMDHINLHLNPEYFKCKYCNKLLSRRICLLKHIKNVHEQKSVECDICGKRLTNELNLKTHKRLHDEENKTLHYKQCDKCYTSKKSLTNHIRIFHINNQSRICDLCGKCLSNHSKFKRHMSEHEGKVKPMVNCELCGRRLSDIGCLRRHMSSRHPAEGAKTDFKCPQCTRIFTSNANLKNHIWSVHENKYVRKCVLCEKTFKKPGSLKDHMAWHSGEPLHTCGICPKKFFSNSNMHAHRKKDHPKEWEESLKEKYITNTIES